MIFRDIKAYAVRSLEKFLFIVFRCVKAYLPLYIWYNQAVDTGLRSPATEFLRMWISNRLRPARKR